MDDNARHDISASGLWEVDMRRHEKTFIDVRVFKPLAATRQYQPISTCLQKPRENKVKSVSKGQRILSKHHLPHYSGILCLRLYDQRGHQLLQAIGFKTCGKMGSILLRNNGMASLSSFKNISCDSNTLLNSVIS